MTTFSDIPRIMGITACVELRRSRVSDIITGRGFAYVIVAFSLLRDIPLGTGLCGMACMQESFLPRQHLISLLVTSLQFHDCFAD
jgi:hypothetical protein